MTKLLARYDVVIVGGGHNGLVAACYLAKAGKTVLVLERNETLGGATASRQIFPDFDARLSVYSYLVSLLPVKIVDDLGLRVPLIPRRTASWTPQRRDGTYRELLIRNCPSDRDAMVALTGNDQDYRGYQQLQRMQQQVADVVWPSLLSPMISRQQMRSRLPPDAIDAWEALIEKPLGDAIETLIDDDLIRGMLFTDAKIGLSTWPHDPTLLQNRCFLYHVIGRGDGRWHVPVGGMGTLVEELLRVARATRRVSFQTHSDVDRIVPGEKQCEVAFHSENATRRVEAEFVLCNASADVLGRLLDEPSASERSVEGAGFKINMLLRKLPKLRSQWPADEALAGTVHIDEGYRQMQESYRASTAGDIPDTLPGEIYCHTLADPTILSAELQQRGFHTITLFGLDLPYSLFVHDNANRRELVVRKYIDGINRYLQEPLEDCLARDANGQPCLEAMSAVDLEHKLRLPKGNIFHGDLSWPFVESEQQAGCWGVETRHRRVLICGSAAMRGGAVSGIPGHNAAMKVLATI